jgi:DNA-binding beta-propeller fold protein YncE
MGGFVFAVMSAPPARAQNATSTVIVGGAPSGIAVNPVTNKVYVETGGDNVAVIDGSTNTASTIAAGSSGSIAVNPVTNKIYVSNGPFSGIISPPHVTVIDGASGTATVIAPGAAGFISVNPVTNKIYVANAASVMLIDGTTNETSLAAGGSSGPVAVDPAADEIFISGPKVVTEIDDATSTTTTIAPGSGGSIAVNPATNKAYLANLGLDNLTVFDGATFATSFVTVGSDPGAVVVNPVTNKIYVAIPSSNSVTEIDGATGATTSIPVGTNPQEIEVNPVTDQIYVLGAGDVTVIDGATHATRTVAVGTNPQGIAVNPVNNKIYVANNGSADVTVIDGSAASPDASGARLTNISVRAHVGTGGDILIPGFAIAGSGTETLLVRGSGPALAQFGVPGFLAQPSLSVFDGAGRVIASNTGWGTNSDPGQVAGISAQVGAFAFADASADCALVVSLPAGAYTVHVSGVNDTTGVALAEVYEVSSSGTRLVNISTRAQVGSGANVIIPGFVISGSGTEQLIARADGPALSQFGIPGVLMQPTLSVFDHSGAVVASNTGWTSAGLDLIAGFDAAVGAFPLAPGSADSAQIVSLLPGSYTIQVSGVNGTTGVALAEIYEAP